MEAIEIEETETEETEEETLEDLIKELDVNKTNYYECCNCGNDDWDIIECEITEKIYCCECYAECAFCKRKLSWEYMVQCETCKEPIFLGYYQKEVKNTKNLKFDKFNGSYYIEGSCCIECHADNDVGIKICAHVDSFC